ncbi:MAG: hypothetical protein KDA89_20080 [Planctomycetaceae bacterium]|nr:hypothetical protein [Planctomycetaceae bacterium]
MADHIRTTQNCVLRCFVLAGILCTAEVTEGQLTHRTRDLRVSPADEITIIDPGTSSEFGPEALVNGQQVEIPPPLLIHNFYYTGDRDFRGPVFPGGPTVVVVEHPKTGVRLYLDVNMLPGSPRVVYRSSYIDYHFGDQRIRIQFCNALAPLHYHQPVVRYGRGDRWIQAPSADSSSAGITRWVSRTGLPDAVKSASAGARTVVNRSADGIRRTGEIVTTPVHLVVDSTILGSILKPDPEADAAANRDAAVRRAADELTDRDRSIRTLR